MDREELALLLVSVKEIAAAVKRLEERLEHLETDLRDFRTENRERLLGLGRRLDHDRRIFDLEGKTD